MDKNSFVEYTNIVKRLDELIIEYKQLEIMAKKIAGTVDSKQLQEILERLSVINFEMAQLNVRAKALQNKN